MGYRAKWRIALDLAERAVDAGYPTAVVLAEAAYGDVGDLRDGLRKLELAYAALVKKHTRVQLICSDGLISDPMSAGMVADVIGARMYRETTRREGTQETLASRFAALRVLVVPEAGVDNSERWLVIERRDNDAPPEHYVLSTLPKSLSRKAPVRQLAPEPRTTLGRRVSVGGRPAEQLILEPLVVSAPVAIHYVLMDDAVRVLVPEGSDSVQTF